MDDNKIIELLFQRSESALDEVARKYFPLYKGIIKGVLCDNCDIEECSNDVLLSVWNAIPPNRPDNLSAYICKIARRIAIDRYRYNTSKKRNSSYTVTLSELGDSLPSVSASNEYFNSDENVKNIISSFLHSLDAESEILFIRRYIYFESVASLAERFNIEENRVSVKLYRARKKLKKALEKEGIRI